MWKGKSRRWEKKTRNKDINTDPWSFSPWSNSLLFFICIYLPLLHFFFQAHPIFIRFLILQINVRAIIFFFDPRPYNNTFITWIYNMDKTLSTNRYLDSNKNIKIYMFRFYYTSYGNNRKKYLKQVWFCLRMHL